MFGTPGTDAIFLFSGRALKPHPFEKGAFARKWDFRNVVVVICAKIEKKAHRRGGGLLFTI